MTETQSYVQLSDEQFLADAIKIVDSGHDQGVPLRILGSLAIYAHSKHAPECVSVFHALGRIQQGAPLFTDLDLAGYGRQGRNISQLFDGLKFRPDAVVNGFFGERRLIYYEESGKFHVDVFLDKLQFSHDVEFGSKPGAGRLEMDFPTITLADIVLEKLQIHQIARKDLVDLIVLFLGHDIRSDAAPDRETVDGAYIGALLAEDWGFWYESVQNLSKTRLLLDGFAQAGQMTGQQVARVRDRIAKLEAILQSVPKSRKWEKRAKVGTAKPWYREVEEVVR